MFWIIGAIHIPRETRSKIQFQNTSTKLMHLFYSGYLPQTFTLTDDQTENYHSHDSVAYGRKEGREGGGVLFPGNCFFQIPAQIPQSQPVLLKLKFHSHFSIVFFFTNPSPSAQNPISQPLKKANPSSHFTPSRPSEKFSWINVHVDETLEKSAFLNRREFLHS